MTSDLLRTFNPLRLAGPIFDKELRVASRRRRTYLLRFAYVGLLALYVVPVLGMTMRVTGAGSAVVQVSQAGLRASRVASTIVWLQFLTSQLLAVVLLSGAIGNEIRQRSLDAVLVTPITSLQIVVGKLLSGLLQLVLLLAISLPLLTVVRVFGGVPWDFVFISLCVTLTAAVFTGCLSLLLSVTDRHAYRVVSNAVGWCLVLWAGVPALLALLRWVGLVGGTAAERLLYLSNPYFVMELQTTLMSTAASAGRPTQSLWPVHCLLMLTGAALMLLWAVRRIRRVALAPVPGAGRPTDDRGRKTADGRRKGMTFLGLRSSSVVHRVRGAPIIWKELRRPIFPRGRRGVFNALGLIVAGCLAVGSLLFWVVSARGTGGLACIVIAVLLQVLFIINVATSAASAITREKEARTLPILLTAPLDGRTIILGKALGLLRRNVLLLAPVPLLGLAAYLFTPGAHGAASTAAATMGMFELAAAGDLTFLMGLGLCLSVYLKTTTPAVVATFVLYVASKFFSRIVSGLFFLGIVRASMGGPAALAFGVLVTLVRVAVYAGLGVLLGHVAAAGLRRHCL